MAEDVRVPKGLLTSLVAALVVSLIALAFLMGRQTAAPVAVSMPEQEATPIPLAASQPQEQTLDSRLDQIERRVDKVGSLQVPQAETVEAPVRRKKTPSQVQANVPANPAAVTRESLPAGTSVKERHSIPWPSAVSRCKRTLCGFKSWTGT